VWAELGSLMPDSGGPYHYLLEAYGRNGPGRLFAFLFLWQALLIGPISIASGAVGFAEYTTVFHPMAALQMKLLAVALCLVNLAVLYRSIHSISTLSIVVMVAVVATCVWIILTGALHFHPGLAFDLPPHAFEISHSFWLGLGSAILIATYDYGGYYNACLLGGEIQNPRRNVPRAVLWSIIIVACLYLAMNLSILGDLPWREAQRSKAIVADFMRTAIGPMAAKIVTLLILIASWGSTYAILLGYSRIPYAAAADGRFPAIFARVHPTKHFPTFSLIYMGVGSAAMCLFTLADLIAAMIVIQTLLQTIGQCIAIILLRPRTADQRDVFRMPLFPLPALAALVGWVFIIATSEAKHIAIGLAMAAIGCCCYLIQAARRKEWPFRQA